MAAVKRQTKKLFRTITFLCGLCALVIFKAVSGGSAGTDGATTNLSSRVQNLLAPRASADVPYSQSSYYSEGSYGKFGGGGGGGGDGGGDGDGGDGDGDCCSIVAQYWNGKSFVVFDIFPPRYYQTTLNAIAIPKDAVRASGEVLVRLTATKLHKLHFAGIISPEKEVAVRSEQFGVERAFHNRDQKDYASVLNARQSGEYVRTIPTDVIDVSFNIGETSLQEEEQETYLMRAGGVYTELSDRARDELGDWYGRLDPESQEFLRGMYALKTYHSEERTPVLS